MALLWLDDDVTGAEEAQSQPRSGKTSVDRQIWEALHAMDDSGPDRRSSILEQGESICRRRESDR